MEKVIYLMHVDWAWIKQRPHFIVENLKSDFRVTVIYKYQYNRKFLEKRKKDESIALKPVFTIPQISKSIILKKINRYLKHIVSLNYILKIKPQYLFLTFPDQVKDIPPSFAGKIIYDCMDNHFAIAKHQSQKKLLRHQEEELIKRADIVIVSSYNLKEVLLKSYRDIRGENKVYLIRNGYEKKTFRKEEIPTSKHQSKEFHIVYFGTVSSWFDFKLLEQSLLDFDSLYYDIIGPIDKDIKFLKEERIKYWGTVAHEKLYEYVKDMDCFIMPFVVNEIIESVDPVKLYEYIYFYKNILCIKYKEIEYYSKFVHFYTDYFSFRDHLKKLINNNEVIYSNQDRNAFLASNNWENRVKDIIALIKR